MNNTVNSIIATALFIGVIIIETVFDIPNWLYWTLIITLPTAWIIYTCRKPTSTDKMKKKIIDELVYHGFECKLEEDIITLKRNNRNWEIFLVETSNPKVWKIVFQDRFTLGNPDDIHWIGSAILVDAVNYQFAAKVRGNCGKFACTYESAISTAKDFMEEFGNAWNQIMNSLDWMHENWDEAVKHWPSQKESEKNETKHRVGFKLE